MKSAECSTDDGRDLSVNLRFLNQVSVVSGLLHLSSGLRATHFTFFGASIITMRTDDGTGTKLNASRDL